MRIALFLLLSLSLCTCGRAPTSPVTAGSTTAGSTDKLLQAGPMLGYNDLREVAVWVQTTQAATVQLAYTHGGQRYLSDAVTTEKSQAYTATLIADQVQPGQTYPYDILINGAAVTPSLPHRVHRPGPLAVAQRPTRLLRRRRQLHLH